MTDPFGENRRNHEKSLSLPNLNQQKINIIFYNKWKKYNKIQLTKNKMDLNHQIINNHIYKKNI